MLLRRTPDAENARCGLECGRSSYRLPASVHTANLEEAEGEGRVQGKLHPAIGSGLDPLSMNRQNGGRIRDVNRRGGLAPAGGEQSTGDSRGKGSGSVVRISALLRGSKDGNNSHVY